MAGKLNFKSLFFVLLFCCFTIQLRTDDLVELEQLNTLINSIKTADKNQTNDSLLHLKNPFLDPDEVEIDSKGSELVLDFNLDEIETDRFLLQAIVGDRVKINDEWLKKGDTIQNLKISEIATKFIVLKNENGDTIIKNLKKNDKFTLIKKVK